MDPRPLGGPLGVVAEGRLAERVREVSNQSGKLRISRNLLSDRPRRKGDIPDGHRE
jgi:hypothetical protein